jgi:hypothetical protein
MKTVRVFHPGKIYPLSNKKSPEIGGFIIHVSVTGWHSVETP